jgi:hypothetical protein
MTKRPKEQLLDSLLEAVEQESKEAEHAGREIRIERGERIASEGARHLYRFFLRYRLVVGDDCTCTLTVRGRPHQAIVVSAAESQITVAVPSDLGSHIRGATLRTDEAPLLRQLAHSLRELRQPDGAPAWNRDLAHAALSGAVQNVKAERLHVTAPQDLTEDQQAALQIAADNAVTYLWGPPGTGKTVTLAALVWWLFCSHRRVLIVSHTHRAVDGVVEGLCRRISPKGHVSIPENAILRMGAIVRGSLEQEYGSAVSFDQVIARSESKVSSRIASLKQELSTTRRKVWATSKQLNLWDARAGLQDELQSLTGTLQRSQYGLKGLIGRVMGTSARPSLADTSPGGDIRESISLLEAGIAEIERSLTASNRGEIERLLADLGDRQRELTTGIALLEKFLRELRANLLSHARVVAATATQAFLRAHELTDFDTIVIDEASMLPLPLVYRLCGMAKRSVVIAGDFRQLPPIAVSRSEVVARWYSRDVFDAAGVIEAVNQGRVLPHLAKLTTQFRSREELCSLINERFYGGDLTSRYVDQQPMNFPPSMAFLADHPVVLIDSSDLAPTAQSVGRSRANLVHALLVRRLCLGLRAGVSQDTESRIGVIAPYRAQVELVEDLLNEAGLRGVSVGTVHRFQGEERKLIVLDLTEGPPHSLGSFLSATALTETGARLLNVALSRAQSNLMVVANLSFLHSVSRPAHIIRGVLEDLEKVSLCVRSGELLVPLGLELEHSPRRVNASALAFQGFDEAAFVPALSSDMRDASRTILIVSARLSMARVASFAEILRSKAAQSVSVIVVVPQAHQNGTISRESYEQARACLQALGAQVIEQRTIHSSLVCIDDEVVWQGSLHPLSHDGTRRELMTRTVSRVAARLALEAISTLNAPRTSPARAVNV